MVYIVMYKNNNYKMVLSDILSSPVRRKKQEIPDNLEFTTDIPDMIRIFYHDNINFDQIIKVVKNRLILIKRQDDISNFLETCNEYKESNNIDDFLDYIEKFIKIERIYQNLQVFQCLNCNQELEETNEDNGYIVCSNCNCINNILTPNIYNRDTDRIINYLEDDINNFAKVIDKFEGKSNTLITSDLLSKLDNYFKVHNFYDKDYIKSLPNTKDGKKPYTSKKLIWDALESIGMKMYDDTNYIGYIYWNWKLPNLSDYREQLIEDYKKTQIVWNSIKNKFNRTASLGTQYRLYVHLKALDYDCNKDDFKIQCNTDSIRLHNTIWKIMCDRTGVKYTNVTN